MPVHRLYAHRWLGAVLAWVIVAPSWAPAQQAQRAGSDSTATVMLPVDTRRPLVGYPGGHLWQGFFHEPYGWGPCGRAACASYGHCVSSSNGAACTGCNSCSTSCQQPGPAQPVQQAGRPRYLAQSVWTDNLQPIVPAVQVSVPPAVTDAAPVHVSVWDEAAETPSRVAFASVTNVDMSAVVTNPDPHAAPPSDGTTRLLQQLRFLAEHPASGFAGADGEAQP